MFVLAGLGLSDEKDLSVKSVEALKKCNEVYLENYTSLAPHLKLRKLEALLNKKVKIIGREWVETGDLVLKAKSKKIGLIIVGDPLTATTHAELLIQAKENGIRTKVFHNSNVPTAVGETGLQLYKFGKTLSVPFHKAESFLKTLSDNQKIGAHTLCLLDLDLESNKFLGVADAFKKLKLGGEDKVIVCSRLGCKDQLIKYGKACDLKKLVFTPPNCIIVPGKLHFKEEEFLGGFNA